MFYLPLKGTIVIGLLLVINSSEASYENTFFPLNAMIFKFNIYM